MPRYLFETPAVGAETHGHAATIVRLRFPEIEVEHTYVLERDGDPFEVWVCRAPSEAHVRRFATTAALPLAALRRIDADLAGAPRSQMSEPPSNQGETR